MKIIVLLLFMSCCIFSGCSFLHNIPNYFHVIEPLFNKYLEERDAIQIASLTFLPEEVNYATLPPQEERQKYVNLEAKARKWYRELSNMKNKGLVDIKKDKDLCYQTIDKCRQIINLLDSLKEHEAEISRNKAQEKRDLQQQEWARQKENQDKEEEAKLRRQHQIRLEEEQRAIEQEKRKQKNQSWFGAFFS